VADADSEVSRSIIALLMSEPFFGHLLGGAVRKITEQTQTAAVAVVGDHFELWINEKFFTKTLRRKAERVAVIKHEALHLLFKHCYRFDHKRQQHLLYNVAADLVVNQFIGSPWQLPEGAVTLATFPDLSLSPDQSVDWYYDKLATLQSEMAACGWPGGEQGQGQGQGQGGEGQGQGQGGEGEGEDQEEGEGSDGGGGGGMPDYSGTSAPVSAEVLHRLGGSTWHSDHAQWRIAQGDEVGPHQVVAGDSALGRLIAQARDRSGPKAWGSMPGALQQAMRAAIEELQPKVDWKRRLRLFTSSSRRTRIVATRTKESRRYGTFPGIKVKRFQKLAVAIDTSGSVDDHSLSLMYAEVHGMWRQGAEVTIIECDAAVQRVWDYKGRRPTDAAGRGGTVFDPVFQYLRDNRKTRYDGCIYLTDGYASEPTVKPPCKLLWLITADGKMGDHLKWGNSVQLPPA
jgi:predicted metal-dependent peptidase